MHAFSRSWRMPVILCLPIFLVPAFAAAQDPPPRIGPFVVDVHGTVPRFGKDPELAASRGLALGELPGSGLGLHTAAHVYVYTWRVLTIGLGGSLTLARSHQASTPLSEVEVGRAVTERFTHVAPELSFNFGSGNGWSYISGGIGPAQRTLIPEGGEVTDADAERLRTTNYGGGARWFIKPHLAFTFDVRFHEVDVGTPFSDRVASPRSTLLIMSAGVSFK
jgi:hypothetical protein